MSQETSETFLRFEYPGQTTACLPKKFREPGALPWVCSACHTPRVGCGPVDLTLTRGSPLQWPLNAALECLVGYARRDFLERFGWDRVTRDLYIGQVFNEKGQRIESLVTFRGRYLLFGRGTARARCRRCETCSRQFFYTSDERYLYPAPPDDAELFEGFVGALIAREHVAAPVAAIRWPHVKVDRLSVLDPPPDGLPALPFDN